MQHAGTRRRWQSVFLAAGMGLAISLTQIVFSCAVQSKGISMESYLRFFQWDSEHYAKLMTIGYKNTLPPLIGDTDPGVANFQKNTNAAFFPGYVIAGRIVRALTGFTPRVSLLLASVLAAWGFWSTLLLLLRRWQFSKIAQSIIVLAIAVHPAAFFLVAAYSESLFLLGLTGFIYWSHARKPAHAFAAVAHGMVMTGTRIFGAVFLAYPVIVSTLCTESRTAKVKDLLRAAAISLVSSFGMLGFFAYSSVVLGKWNLYMRVQEKMWGIAPEYSFLFHWSEVFPLPLLRHPLLYGNNLSPFLATMTLWCLVAGIVVDVVVSCRRKRPDETRPERAALWICAAGSWYMTAASLVGSEFRSMIRYSYIPYILGILAVALLLRDSRWSRQRVILAILLFAGFVAASLWVQNYLIHAFTAGLWVA